MQKQNFLAAVINLDKDKDRMESMRQQLHRQGIAYDRLSGIVGEEYKGEEYDASIIQKMHMRALRPGEVGCALSHKRCYEKLIKMNAEDPGPRYMLIMEDDIVIKSPEFKQIIEKEIERNEKHKVETGEYLFEYLQFSYPKTKLMYIFTFIYFESYLKVKEAKGVWNKILLTIRKVGESIALFFVLCIRKIIDATRTGPIKIIGRPHLTTGCYLINVSAARRLLPIADKIIYAADIVTYYAKKDHGLRYAYYLPRIVSHDLYAFGSNTQSPTTKGQIDSYGRRVVKKKWYSIW